MPKRLRLRGRPPAGTHAWWYDVLWKYWESVRYNPLSVQHVEAENAFYWNRSIRWVTALTTTGLMWLASRGATERTIVKVWEETRRRNSILQGVYSNCSKAWSGGVAYSRETEEERS